MEIKLRKQDYFVEAVAFLLLLASAYPLFIFGSLPDSLPMHYNAAGEVDGWGGKGIIFILPAISVAVYVGLSVLSRYPNRYNYPVAVTAENKQQLYLLGVRLVRCVKLFTLALFAYISLNVAGVFGDNTSLNSLVMVLLICALMSSVLYFSIKMSRWR